jgi:hypothetical protein
MFPRLDPFAPCVDAVILKVRELGRRGGLMDALDPRGHRRQPAGGQ